MLSHLRSLLTSIMQECSPARYRGLMISSFQIWTSIGTLVGTVVDNCTSPPGGRKSYLIPLGIVYGMPVFLFFGLFFIPDSPRWLMQHGKVEQARKSLRWHRPHSDVWTVKPGSQDTGKGVVALAVAYIIGYNVSAVLAYQALSSSS